MTAGATLAPGSEPGARLERVRCRAAAVGAKSLGQELAGSSAFAQCQVQKVFQAVCFRAPQSQADLNQIPTMVSSFTAGGYKLKQVFAQSAVYCMGP